MEDKVKQKMKGQHDFRKKRQINQEKIYELN